MKEIGAASHRASLGRWHVIFPWIFTGLTTPGGAFLSMGRTFPTSLFEVTIKLHFGPGLIDPTFHALCAVLPSDPDRRALVCWAIHFQRSAHASGVCHQAAFTRSNSADPVSRDSVHKAA